MGDGRNLSLGVERRRGRIFWFALLASISWAIAASPFGCGLDDTAITQFGVPDGGDATVTISDSGPDAEEACAPKSCNSYPSSCRSGLSNGCGQDNLDCSKSCTNGAACILDSGTCSGPPICYDAGEPGGNCGTIVNPGNGLEAGCGDCTGNYACSASTCGCVGKVCGSECCNGATPDCALAANTCCKMKTCTVDYPGQCGAALNDGCGGTLNCSGFCGAQVCDTTAAPAICCAPETVGAACGTSCNTNVMNNCHQAIPCPATCANGDTCSGTTCQCTSAKTCGAACCPTNKDVCNGSGACCTPDSMATTCALACGTQVPNNCGQLVNCGDCNASSNFKCESNSTPTGCVCGGPPQCAFGDACCFGGGGHSCHGGFTCP